MLDPSPAPPLTDEAAKQRLRTHAHLANQRIWCEVSEGKLRLHGHVPSFYHKQLAQEAFGDLSGVVEVVNEIEVVW